MHCTRKPGTQVICCAILLVLFCNLSGQAQPTAFLTIRHQVISGDTLFFDVYIQSADTNDIYLGDCDYVLSYDSANFEGTLSHVQGSSLLYNRKGNRTHHYDYALFTQFGHVFNEGQLYLYNTIPVINSQYQFDTRIAQVDNVPGKHRLATFYLTGMKNVSLNPQFKWVVSQPRGVRTMMFSLDTSTWNGSLVNVNVMAVDPLIAAEPNYAATNPLLNYIDDTEVNLSWDEGNGTERLVLLSNMEFSADTLTADGVQYESDERYGEGTAVGTEEVFAIYNGDETTITVQNLEPATMYYYSIIEYNGDSGYSENYADTFLTDSFKTADQQFVPLPVELLEFTALFSKNHIPQLTWMTASELTNSGFHIERSSDAINWKKISFVPSKASQGNSSVPLSYELQDIRFRDAKSDIIYYRLIQEDMNGERSIKGDIQALRVDRPISFNVCPNPASEWITISAPYTYGRGEIVTISDQTSTTVYEGSINGALKLDVSGYAAGVYFLTVGSQYNSTQKFNINR